MNKQIHWCWSVTLFNHQQYNLKKKKNQQCAAEWMNCESFCLKEPKLCSEYTVFFCIYNDRKINQPCLGFIGQKSEGIKFKCHEAIWRRQASFDIGCLNSNLSMYFRKWEKDVSITFMYIKHVFGLQILVNL